MYTMKKWFISDNDHEGHVAAISNLDGSYIGREEFAQFLDDLGIEAQAIPGERVASIGFSKKDKKWYGWGHRAIHGFGVGSNVKKGDCAYVAPNWYDFIVDSVAFWYDSGYYSHVTGEKTEDKNGVECVKVELTYVSDKELIPNEKLHGQRSSVQMYPPEKWGNGEWSAETLDDAKQMAIDFANGVA